MLDLRSQAAPDLLERQHRIVAAPQALEQSAPARVAPCAFEVFVYQVADHASIPRLDPNRSSRRDVVIRAAFAAMLHEPLTRSGRLPLGQTPCCDSTISRRPQHYRGGPMH